MRLTMAIRPKLKPQLKPAAEPTGLVLGIDSGATKTVAGVATRQKLLGLGKSGAGNLHTNSVETVTHNLTEAITKAMPAGNTTRERFDHVVVGMTGIDSPQDQIKAERLLKKIVQPWSHARTSLTVVNDIHIVRRSGSNDPFGVALIAGTGTHCFGLSQTGDVAYAGGLGHILADEGSGYDIGLKVLRAAVRSADGRSRHTKLEEAVLQHYKIKSIRALEPVVYHSNQFGKTQIANLAKLVDNVAAQGDWRAREILAETIAELVAHVRAIVYRLHLEKTTFDIVVVGGLFEITAVPLFARFKRAIKTIAPQASVIKPTDPPVWGAIRLAQDELDR